MVDGGLVEFTKRMKDMLSSIASTRRVKTIDFLNISEQLALERMVAKFAEIATIYDGGFESAQRKRGVVFPTDMLSVYDKGLVSYTKIESLDTKVSIFKIEVIGSGEITHSQVLGSLMGLAIDRCVIGDIVVDSGSAFFAACSEFDEFLKANFTKVGRYNIRLDLIEETINHEENFVELEIVVSSMRLDVVVKALINVARGKAEKYLEAGFVRLNHVVDKKASRVCQIGDVLSIRKHGRFKLVKNKKTTKRGKFVVVVSKNV